MHGVACERGLQLGSAADHLNGVMSMPIRSSMPNRMVNLSQN
jgi:hypothetical protein